MVRPPDAEDESGVRWADTRARAADSGRAPCAHEASAYSRTPWLARKFYVPAHPALVLCVRLANT